MKLLICDLDGVINGSSDARADLVPGIKTKSTFWAKWHKAHVREDLNMDMLPLLRMYKEQGFEIAYLTNRQRECWNTTAEQLEVFPTGRLFMRHMLDDTPPPEFKACAGRDLSEQEAWTFLICLKLVRQCRKHQEDNIVDLVAYAALLGESYMTAHDEIQVDTTAAQYDSLKGWPIASAGTWHPSSSVGKTVKAANFGIADHDVQPMVVLTGEDGSKILMTPEDFRNMEKTLVTGALK